MTETAFTDAVKRNNQRLFLIALSFTQNRTDAEDILQSVFLKLWKYDKSFESAEHLDKWLTRVTVNESKNLLRSPFRKQQVPLDEIESAAAFSQESDYDLFKAVTQLPQKLRTVIHLFYYEDMPVKEIASLLKLRESTVKTRLSRGRAQLKDQLGDEWNHE